MTKQNSINMTQFSSVHVQVFIGGTSTYTPTPGMLYCQVEICAGGGGSGGAAGTAGQLGCSGGGGGGSYSLETYSAAQIGATATVVVGAGGSAGTAGNNAGGTGGTSSFTPTGSGGTLSCLGGTGSGGSISTATSGFTGVGGQGQAASGGALNIAGANGNAGIVINGASGFGLTGIGGGCPRFSNAAGNYANTTVTGTQPGQGAPGVLSFGNANIAGQPGVAGQCLITEYCNQ